MKSVRKIVSLLTAVCMVVSLAAVFTITASASAGTLTEYTPKSYEPAMGTFVAGHYFDDTHPDEIGAWSSEILTTSKIDSNTIVVGFTMNLGCEQLTEPSATGETQTAALRFNGSNIAMYITEQRYGSSSAISGRLLLRFSGIDTTKEPYQYNSSSIGDSNYTRAYQQTLSGGEQFGLDHDYTFILKKHDDNKVYIDKAYLDGNEIEFSDVTETTYDSTKTTFESSIGKANTIPLADAVNWDSDVAASSAGVVNIRKIVSNTKIQFKEAYVYIPAAETPVVGVQTRVAKPSYLPEVGTAVLDEDFESTSLYTSTSATYVHSNYENGAASYSITHDATDAKNYGLVGTADNNYIKANQWQVIKSAGKGAVDSDRFVVSFDFMPPEAAETHTNNGAETNAYAGTVVNICFGGNYTGVTGNSPVIRLIFEKSNNATSARFRINHKKDEVSTYLSNYTNNVPFDTFSKFSCVFDTVTVDGVKQAYLSKAYYNGTEISLSVDSPESYYTPHWSSVDATLNTIYIGNFGIPTSYTNVVYKGMNYDNFLAYLPATASTAVSGAITGTLAADETLTGTITNLPAQDAYAILAYYGDKQLLGLTILSNGAGTITIPSGTLPTDAKVKLIAIDKNLTPLMPAVQIPAE